MEILYNDHVMDSPVLFLKPVVFFCGILVYSWQPVSVLYDMEFVSRCKYFCLPRWLYSWAWRSAFSVFRSTLEPFWRACSKCFWFAVSSENAELEAAEQIFPAHQRVFPAVWQCFNVSKTVGNLWKNSTNFPPKAEQESINLIQELLARQASSAVKISTLENRTDKRKGESNDPPIPREGSEWRFCTP